MEAFEAQETVVLVISKYDAEETASWLKEHGWTMPFLVDGREVIERYGILAPDYLDDPDRAGLPHPTTIIVDKAGIVRFKNIWVNYRERTTPETMLSVLEDIND